VEKNYISKELNDLFSSPNIVWERRDVYWVLVGKPEGKRPLGRLRRRWEDNTKIDIQEVRTRTGSIWLRTETGDGHLLLR
jgi:hypothetical protein